MKSILVVVKTGVYRHELCGCHPKLDKAMALAEKARGEEKDNYHDFDLIEVFYDGREEVHVARLTGEGNWELACEC